MSYDRENWLHKILWNLFLQTKRGKKTGSWKEIADRIRIGFPISETRLKALGTPEKEGGDPWHAKVTMQELWAIDKYLLRKLGQGQG